MDYRHELKFIVSDAVLALIEKRIAHIVKPDPHQVEEDGYLITSLYFDGFNDPLLNESIQGCDIRHKYRLRIYDHSSELIKLERKSKVHGMTAKKSITVTQSECIDMMHGHIPTLQTNDSTAKKRVLCEMKLVGFKPKCVVQYNRKAFINDVGNVRITFDQNIGGTRDVLSFFDERIQTTPLLRTGVHVLEVKYDNLLPKYISDLLEIERLQQTSFSKYVYTRNTLG